MDEQVDRALVPAESAVYLGTLAVAPEAVIDRAARIASTLAKVIRDRRLYRRIGASEHVLVEGWTTLGALVGLSPKEREVHHRIDADGVHEFEAYVDLVRADNGAVVGGASAICRTDENNWEDRPLYAVRSMAITRATGKAFRLRLAFIMELAGYATTPAEEMDGLVEGKARPAEDPGPAAQPGPRRANGEVERPLAAGTLRSYMAVKVDRWQQAIEGGRRVTPQQRGLAIGMLTQAFAPYEDADEKARSVAAYRFSVESRKDLSDAAILSLLDWLKPGQDEGGHYAPDPMAVREARIVLLAHLADLGQQEMALGGEP